MLFSDFLQIIAVLIEVAITVTAGVLATQFRKPYGWCIAVTFGLFVLFDIGRLTALPVSDETHSLIFLVACGSMLYGILLIYRELEMRAHAKG